MQKTILRHLLFYLAFAIFSLVFHASVAQDLESTAITLEIKPSGKYEKDTHKPIRVELSTPKKPATATELRFRKPRGGYIADYLFACAGALRDCASLDTNLPIAPANSEIGIMIGDPTTQVSEIRLGQWAGAEAFPLCGWSANPNGFSPAGGVCHVLAVRQGDTVLIWEFSLGRNTGCQPSKSCFKSAVEGNSKLVAQAKVTTPK
jgi:hypothetical protein